MYLLFFVTSCYFNACRWSNKHTDGNRVRGICIRSHCYTSRLPHEKVCVIIAQRRLRLATLNIVTNSRKDVQITLGAAQPHTRLYQGHQAMVESVFLTAIY